ncbi:ornithine cyclodeaminase family protein [Desulfosporosinus sp. BICA1-9]|uniref:ornithine cyclodeaminase family protein n=1 Tax=Desulfosporosinus sp. BICA1-9 TaxID=1531958 RepID=UPI00054B6AAF|nr:ornithine cyclodeaminase family protein [Desulfosporosinus sp. BICA1-9]KJS48816.1 MAG: hypothetical protein VR66_11805 [Peptococcaceae bacterium BRH_c23]KJS87094.1 MAG: hypothetical protein JL57_15085 [Desulfosporosinus sp. BICA1-9]HBW34158.1 ornithine cyclodeaminase family protein [Desulfosporosinus sp.]
MLVLSNEEITKILEMKDCIEILEESYLDLAQGRALYSPGVDNLAPSGRGDAYYAFKHTGGTWPNRGIQALRIKSDIINHELVAGIPRRVKLPLAGGRWVGLVLLFSTESGELLAMFPDGVAQRMRVGGSSGLGVKYMARPDARKVALIGSGWQAGSQLMAVLAVRAVEQVKVFSLRRESREQFAREATQKYGIPIQAVDTPEECVKDADIILAATSSMLSVIKPEWLKKGVHLSCIKPQEIDSQVLARCDRVVVHIINKDQHNDNIMLGTPGIIKEHVKGWWILEKEKLEQSNNLMDLVSKRALGRVGEDEITFFYNNDGVGLQFAAVGSLILERARLSGMGTDLPREWFTESVHP